MIVTGAMSDPYVHAEQRLRQTRQALEVIKRTVLVSRFDQINACVGRFGFADRNQPANESSCSNDSDDL